MTVVDDGTIENRRGSLTIDDEGTPTQRTVLIEDGILKGYLQDRMNARLWASPPTGNGRRESYAHAPMPRMTNTFMTAGDHDPAELSSLKNGVYAEEFRRRPGRHHVRQVRLPMHRGYVEDGTIAAPIKGATLIGDGPSALTRVKASATTRARRRRRHVRQGRTERARRCWPADDLIDGLTVGGTAA